MEIDNPINEGPQGKVVFIRIEPPMLEQLEQLRVQMRGRGIATVIRRILVKALAEGVTVQKKRPAGRRRAEQEEASP